MKLITLTQGYCAEISDEDFEFVSMFKWVIFNQRGYIYAINDKLGYLHRFILGVCSSHIFVDHKDRNTLNCQRSNLRVATPQQNCFNSRIHKDSTTGYKGVYYNKKSNNYSAIITKDGNTKIINGFNTKYEAMVKYNELAVKLFGDFAGLNVPTFEDNFKRYLRGETNVMPIR